MKNIRACPRVKNLLDNPHFWRIVKVEFIIFTFAFMSIYVSADDQNVVFGNVSLKWKYLVTEGSDVRLITGMCSRTVARDDRCSGVAIKCSAHHSWLDFLEATLWF